jgi:hypothetical protein
MGEHIDTLGMRPFLRRRLIRLLLRFGFFQGYPSQRLQNVHEAVGGLIAGERSQVARMEQVLADMWLNEDQDWPIAKGLKKMDDEAEVLKEAQS